MARTFNGSSNYVASPTSMTVPLTMACWFKANNNTTFQSLISINRNTSSDHWITLSARGSQAGDPVSLAISSGGGIFYADTTTGYTNGMWYHACGVIASATNRKSFINGGSSGTSTNSSTPTSQAEITIGSGRFATGLGLYFNGKIAAPAIWNVALTDDEVKALAAGIRPDQIRPQNLVSYNLFDPRTLDMQGNSWTNTGSTESQDHPPLR